MLRPPVILFVLIVLLLCGACAAQTPADGDLAAADGGLVADANTLFLERFEEDIQQADYALGLSALAGNGATQVPGYYGQGIDLRRSGLQADFMRTSRRYTPRSDGWGFHSRGNVSPWQGTLECWFRPCDPRLPRLPFSYNFLNADLHQGVYVEAEDRYRGFGLTINTLGIRFCLPTVAGNTVQGDLPFRTIPGFQQALKAEDWHHFAMTWDQGALVLYLDGRRIVSHDMTGEQELLLVASPVRYLNMSDIFLDELRISNVVRFAAEFEPAWRDGKRPDYAFTGNPAAPAYPGRSLATVQPARLPVSPGPVQTRQLGPYTLQLAPDGSLAGFAVAGMPPVAAPSRGGLLLWRGLEHAAMAPTAMRDLRAVDGHLRFEQGFAGGVRVLHDLHESGGTLHWQATLQNDSDAELWLEPMLSLDLPLGPVQALFDGVEPRVGDALTTPRYRDEYANTLPYVAAADGKRFLGLGVDPQVDLSDIVSHWIPAAAGAATSAPPGGPAVLRQGARVALSPGEAWTLRFVVVQGGGDFGVLDAVSAYHATYPELYHLRPDVTVYTYMPMTQYDYSDPYFDMKRVGWAGNFWGHGPGHDKGDEYGTPEFWNNPRFYGHPAYERYTRHIERLWGTPQQLREVIPLKFRQSYDNWYPVRRFHTCPDVTPTYIVDASWPGYEPNEDPLCFGQYYKPTYAWAIINEYNTPVGAHIQDQARRYMLATAGYCPGFINDMSHAGSLYRHNDPIARQTKGRAWSRDLGTFVRKAVGRRQRYEILNSTVLGGTRLTMWSDGGSFSYTLGAFSAGMAIEGAGMYRDLTGSASYVSAARYLVGEKPFSAMTHVNDDWIGYYLDPKDFPDAKSLRDYYRFAGRQLMLWAIRHGVSLDPSSYMFGRQAEHELNPLLVESTVRGRQVVPAATVDAPLWVVRAGHDLQTLLVIGNTEPSVQTAQVRVAHRYFDGWPIFARYYGGGLQQDLQPAHSTITGIDLEPRDAEGLMAVAMLETAAPAKAKVQLSGDGITVTLALDLTLAADARLRLTDLAPVYELATLTLDGGPVRRFPGEGFAIAAGTHRLVATYRSPQLDFDAADWAAVDLLRDGQANVVIVGEASTQYVVRAESPSIVFKLGFEAGTLGMFSDFLEQYDSENGVRGDLLPVPILPERAADDTRWALSCRQDPLLSTGTVRIDTEARSITVLGPTPGERRRAMVVWMRLVDRKYPHVGRFHPFAFRTHKWTNESVDLDKWSMRKPTREFFRAFSADPLFMAKPILDPRYEALYADGNMDFAGAYTLRTPPFLVEPTADDDYVYGYKGEAGAASHDALLRQARPEPAPEPELEPEFDPALTLEPEPEPAPEPKLKLEP